MFVLFVFFALKCAQGTRLGDDGKTLVCDEVTVHRACVADSQPLIVSRPFGDSSAMLDALVGGCPIALEMFMGCGPTVEMCDELRLRSIRVGSYGPLLGGPLKTHFCRLVMEAGTRLCHARRSRKLRPGVAPQIGAWDYDEFARELRKHRWEARGFCIRCLGKLPGDNPSTWAHYEQCKLRCPHKVRSVAKSTMAINAFCAQSMLPALVNIAVDRRLPPADQVMACYSVACKMLAPTFVPNAWCFSYCLPEALCVFMTGLLMVLEFVPENRSLAQEMQRWLGGWWVSDKR